MKTFEKIWLASFLVGSMLMSVLITQGQNVKTNVPNGNTNVNKPYISAGPDVSICKGDGIMLQGESTFTGGITYWTTNGDGTFDHVSSLNAIYTPGPKDFQKGKVLLTLVFFPYIITNQPIHDDVMIHFGDCWNVGNVNEM
jgi:hypothetical protein